MLVMGPRPADWTRLQLAEVGARHLR
jgi:hypothetical protein